MLGYHACAVVFLNCCRGLSFSKLILFDIGVGVSKLRRCPTESPLFSKVFAQLRVKFCPKGPHSKKIGGADVLLPPLNTMPMLLEVQQAHEKVF